MTEPRSKAACEVQYWLSETESKSLPFSQYWNDPEEEKRKPWYILDGDFGKMERYLEDVRLVQDLEACLQMVKHLKGGLRGVGADLAAGVLWAVPHLFRAGAIEKLYCVEYSKHRLVEIGPKVLEHYGAPLERVVLCLGDFYVLHLGDASLDFVLLAEAFHHAEHPYRLLAEVRRVLKPDGVVLLLGEGGVLEFSLSLVTRHLAKFFVSRFFPTGLQRRLLGKVLPRQRLFSGIGKPPADPVMGDRYYSHTEYLRIFARAGFEAYHPPDSRAYTSFYVLCPQGNV